MSPAVLLTALLAAVPVENQEQRRQTFTFNTRVTTVYVDVFASRHGKPLSGLTEKDFVVRDNGVVQDNLRLANLSDFPLYTALVLDSSGSVMGSRFRELREAALTFSRGLDAGDAVALLTASREFQLLKDFQSGDQALLQALAQPPPGGPTAMLDAVFAALSYVETGEGRPVILLLTDGLDNASWLDGEAMVSALRTSDVVLYVVGINPPVSGVRTMSSVERWIEKNPEVRQAHELLRALSGVTGGRVIRESSKESLSDAFAEIIDEMKTRYLLYYQPGEVTEGWHDLDVRLTGKRGVDVRARPGYVMRP